MRIITTPRLVQLYEAWNQPDEAAKWRAKLLSPASPSKKTESADAAPP
ncbi:MAG: hypothetical protein IID44_29435 [Planctomycetes bacterium]|nr:hypothetical protein [Planctomycetota bacterium]